MRFVHAGLIGLFLLPVSSFSQVVVGTVGTCYNRVNNEVQTPISGDNPQFLSDFDFTLLKDMSAEDQASITATCQQRKDHLVTTLTERLSRLGYDAHSMNVYLRVGKQTVISCVNHRVLSVTPFCSVDLELHGNLFLNIDDSRFVGRNSEETCTQHASDLMAKDPSVLQATCEAINYRKTQFHSVAVQTTH